MIDAKNKNLRKKNTPEKTITNYCNVVNQGVSNRWKLFNLDLFKTEFFEVIGGMLARQANLTTQFAKSPSIWNPDIAPLIYRTQIDNYINLAWILEDDSDTRSKRFILYGLGQEKLAIEHLESNDNKDTIANEYIYAKKNWLNEQLFDFLTEVDLANWSGLTTRKMAEEANCLDLYNYAYSPFSSAIHNMWPHIARHDLKKCQNPIHKKHRIPLINKHYQSDFNELLISAKYVQKSFVLVDKKLKLSCKVPGPYDYLFDLLKWLDGK